MSVLPGRPATLKPQLRISIPYTERLFIGNGATANISYSTSVRLLFWQLIFPACCVLHAPSGPCSEARSSPEAGYYRPVSEHHTICVYVLNIITVDQENNHNNTYF